MESTRTSLENLQTFSLVKEARSRKTLRLRGAYFSIFHSSLMELDPESDAFRPVTVQESPRTAPKLNYTTWADGPRGLKH